LKDTCVVSLETGPDEYTKFVMLVFSAVTVERVRARRAISNKVRTEILAFTNQGHVPAAEGGIVIIDFAC
jgi:hypothetical protein